MTAKTTDAAKQLTYLSGALKAPRILESATRLADQARAAGWSFEDYLAAVLEREVSARNASGAELRIRAAGFGARKTLEDFDFDTQPAARNQVAALASGGFLTEARNVVLLGPPGTGKTHLAIALGIQACRHGHRALFATATDWVTRLSDAHRAGRLSPPNWSSSAATGSSSSTKSATCPSNKTPRTCSSNSSAPATNTHPWSSPATCPSAAGAACSETKSSPPP